MFYYTASRRPLHVDRGQQTDVAGVVPDRAEAATVAEECLPKLCREADHAGVGLTQAGEERVEDVAIYLPPWLQGAQMVRGHVDVRTGHVASLTEAAIHGILERARRKEW